MFRPEEVVKSFQLSLWQGFRFEDISSSALCWRCEHRSELLVCEKCGTPLFDERDRLKKSMDQ
jgi:hypothetical protein